tara:strand:- start:3054 stop:4907 length:1854 start_codon:yes stop_codon:yes gene_type:complete
MPSPSFFTSENKIPIAQKKISVRAENGLEYSLGQKIDFVIPGGIGYMMPSETYLRFDVKIKLPTTASVSGTFTRLALDHETGANVLIRDIRISSGGAQNVVLEEIQNANILTCLKYDYETNDTLKSKRAVTEGCLDQDPKCRGTMGGTKSVGKNTTSNPYYSENKEISAGKGTASGRGIENFETVKALLKIPGGIFGNDKVYPLQLTDGLRIEILLEQPNRVFRQTESVIRDKNIMSNPVFHSVDGDFNSPTAWGTAAAGAANVTTTVYLDRANNQTGIENCPFTIGEEISFYNASTGVDVGDKITSNTGTVVGCVIKDITFDGSKNNGAGLTLLTLEGTCTYTGGSASIVNGGEWHVYSRAVEAATSYDPTLTIDNVELLVQQVQMPQGYTQKMMSMLKAGGQLRYDFLSYTNYKYSQQSSDRVANIRLPLVESRAKSILAIPTDATVLSTKKAIQATDTYVINNVVNDCGGTQGGTVHAMNRSTRGGLVGITDNATDYQFVYAGKLNPSRKVPLDRVSVNVSGNLALNQQWCIEAEKALYMAGIDCLSFLKYQDNFFIGRALSLSNGVYDARGRDFNLQIEYTGDRPPTQPKLWNCYCAHLRSIVVKGDQISVEV